jgi:hypothetical protein
MSRHTASARDAAVERWVEAPHRCLSCNGIIAEQAEQDLGIGLDLGLGLVSDECALICNECTAKLIEPRATAGIPVARRR